MTLEHASVWNWGDLFIFYDRTQDRELHEYAYYLEISPRISLVNLGLRNESPLIKDILIATTLERGSDDFKANLIGPGITWNLAPFTHLETNLYYRDNPDLHGGTWQVTAAWVLPIKLG